MKKALKVLIWILIIGAAAGAVGYRFLAKKKTVEVETRPNISCRTPEMKDIVNYTEAVGTVEPAEEVNVLPKIGGEITEVNFALGDHVQAGDALVSIHSDALKSLQIQVDSAKIAMNDAAAALGRTQELFASGAVSQQQFESAQSAAKSTKLAYENAKTQLDLQSGYTTVTAPISGVIETKNAEVHGMAAPASPICTITGEGGMNISFGVPEEALPNITVGSEVDIEKNADVIKGTVTEVSGKVSASGLYTCKAELAENGNLLSGSKAKVKLVSAKAVQALTVPLAAVSYADGKPFVYLYDSASGTVRKNNFESGLSDQESIEVSSGIEKDAQVVVTWSKEIYDGAPVTTGQ